jgi:hypothetical protein
VDKIRKFLPKAHVRFWHAPIGGFTTGVVWSAGPTASTRWVIPDDEKIKATVAPGFSGCVKAEIGMMSEIEASVS